MSKEKLPVNCGKKENKANFDDLKEECEMLICKFSGKQGEHHAKRFMRENVSCISAMQRQKPLSYPHILRSDNFSKINSGKNDGKL